MTALLLISVSIIILALASAFYLRVKRSLPTEAERSLPPMPAGYAGLFGAREETRDDTAALERARLAQHAASLRERAAGGEKETLLEAHAAGVRSLYEEVLNALVSRAASSEEELNELADYVTSHEQLRGSAALAEAVLERLERNADRASITRALRVAALSDDARVFGRAVESVLRSRREGRLADCDAEQLAALLEAEYWTLPSEARGSGAGFVLKQTLADARRELLAASERRAARKAEHRT